jgi:hypothetical protein
LLREERIGKMKGYIKKLSPGILKGWQKRYYQVQGDGTSLVYYIDDKADVPKGVIPLKYVKNI